MSDFRQFLRAGHSPTLFAAFFYLMFSFVIWVLNGAMAPFISEQFQLTAAQKGTLLSIPIIAGAVMRFPLGLLAQYVGRKTATLVELSLITFTMAFGYFFVSSYDDMIKMAFLLGVAGASFGVAMSLGSGWFPPQYKGLAMGLVGAGNGGTALAALLAPPLAQKFGWQAVYGIAALASFVPMAVVAFMAKEPPDRDEHASLKEHLACLLEKDGWVFSLIYVVTFGGFIGITTFLPTYYHDQFGVSKVQAGQLTMLAALMGSVVRIFGGWISDRWGGVNTLTVVLVVVSVGLVGVGLVGHSLVLTTLLLIVCFAALGAGNGALFQLVPLRWPMSTAVAGSMIGEIGALGGGLVPLLMGNVKQQTGSFLLGFVVLAVFSVLMLAVMRKMQLRWTRTWAEKGGRARVAAPGQAAAAPRVTGVRRVS
ncbi:MFS transporter [Ideonella livida]|uniref:NarK/NasA family nitrate transporter n=1 Tax=Ideonella livida TaxID=2707176 RepID=A0A7C9PJN6_9BURK|nr:MFS transporter [Ideonella livida]NDY92732.1 NarK/NasA family nitrate transporter [Ideonella livida]